MDYISYVPETGHKLNELEWADHAQRLSIDQIPKWVAGELECQRKNALHKHCFNIGKIELSGAP